jgi:hypothetical protein
VWTSAIDCDILSARHDERSIAKPIAREGNPVFATKSLRQKSVAYAVLGVALSFAWAVPAREGELKTWTLRTGEQIEARFTQVSARMVTLSRERGKLFINGKPYKDCMNEPDVRAFIVERSLPDKSESALGLEVAKRGRGKPVTLPLFFMHYEKADGSTGKVAVGALSTDDIVAVTPEVENWWTAQVLAAQQQELENAQAAMEQRRQATIEAHKAAMEAQKREDDSWQWYFISCGTCGRPADPAKQKVPKGSDPAFHKQKKCFSCGGRMTYTATSK